MSYKVILPPKVDPPEHMGKTHISQGPVIPVIPETEPDDIGRILRFWKDTFGVSLNKERVRKHLETLRRWEAKSLKTHE